MSVLRRSNSSCIAATCILLGVCLLVVACKSFVFQPNGMIGSHSRKNHAACSSTALFNSKLPKGISPFEKSVAKTLDVTGSIRTIASKSLQQAVSAGEILLEVDFPPLLGGDQSKTQFDDFDNLQELDANRDWCVQLAPSLVGNLRTRAKDQLETWLIFADDKECELAATEWQGQRFKGAASFTSIRAATLQVCGEAVYAKAWGSQLASSVNKLQGGDGILADSSTLDDLMSTDPTQARLHLVCQPGNGGPVEDWINVERLHTTPDTPVVTCVVNGALDKVRDGYYPGVFFPALAKTTPFYKQFEAVFVLKPISDKGLYGWLYRVYPEPWQVILQTATQGGQGIKVEERVALVSKERPTYAQSVAALTAAASRLPR